MKWISVEERLPYPEEEDVLVICDHRNANVFAGFFMGGEFKYSSNGFYYSDKVLAKSLANPKVTHWFPMPKMENEGEG